VVYFIQPSGGGLVKIGVAVDPEKRLRALQVANHERLVLRRVEEGDEMREAELHKQFAHLRVRGEWFWPGVDLAEYAEAVPGQDEVIESLIASSRMEGWSRGTEEAETNVEAAMEKWLATVVDAFKHLNGFFDGEAIHMPSADDELHMPELATRMLALALCRAPYGNLGVGLRVERQVDLR
jgi:hypothetical protein